MKEFDDYHTEPEFKTNMVTLKYRIDIFETTLPDGNGLDFYVNSEYGGTADNIKDLLKQCQKTIEDIQSDSKLS